MENSWARRFSSRNDQIFHHPRPPARPDGLPNQLRLSVVPLPAPRDALDRYAAQKGRI